jgi:hypothetical protein
MTPANKGVIFPTENNYAKHEMREPHALFGRQGQSMITRPEPERSLAVFPVGIRTHLASILALPAKIERGKRGQKPT